MPVKIGDKKEQFKELKTKDNVVLAGPSLPSLQLKDMPSLLKEL